MIRLSVAEISKWVSACSKFRISRNNCKLSVWCNWVFYWTV